MPNRSPVVPMEQHAGDAEPTSRTSRLIAAADQSQHGVGSILGTKKPWLYHRLQQHGLSTQVPGGHISNMPWCCHGEALDDFSKSFSREESPDLSSLF